MLEVRQLGADALAATTPPGHSGPPKRLSVLLVTQGNPALESALKACPLARLDVHAGRVRRPGPGGPRRPAAVRPDRAGQSRAGPPAAGPVPRLRPAPERDRRDSPQRAEQPGHRRLAGPASGAAVRQPDQPLRPQGRKLELPRDADVLAEFDESPALALVRRQGSMFLLAGFDVLESNWPFEPGFVMFCYNAVSFLGAQVGSGGRHELAVGEPIAIENVPAGTTLTLTRPEDDEGGVDARPERHGPLRGDPARRRVRSGRPRPAATSLCGQPARCRGEPDRASGRNQVLRRDHRRPGADSSSGPTCPSGRCWFWRP